MSGISVGALQTIQSVGALQASSVQLTLTVNETFSLGDTFTCTGLGVILSEDFSSLIVDNFQAPGPNVFNIFTEDQSGNWADSLDTVDIGALPTESFNIQDLYVGTADILPIFSEVFSFSDVLFVAVGTSILFSESLSFNETYSYALTTALQKLFNDTL